MPPTRTVLSFEPKSLMAKFFSHGGVKSISSWQSGYSAAAFAAAVPGTPSACSAPLHRHTLYSLRRRCRFAGPGDYPWPEARDYPATAKP